mmetsp:Transcript_17397/g.36891  ORF Transcript_17397/g.36891 Transcript_17397/m.36891 type:complete len:91 (+) Transcript_17397:182-454(+)
MKGKIAHDDNDATGCQSMSEATRPSSSTILPPARNINNIGKKRFLICIITRRIGHVFVIVGFNTFFIHRFSISKYARPCCSMQAQTLAYF